ncbi:MAG: NAD(P)-binding domain-containing protein, partial [Acidobacteria bacterium]|nr:NAD(P)-binding domain-containing protein [Acidobacteriota bacterium]
MHDAKLWCANRWYPNVGLANYALEIEVIMQFAVIGAGCMGCVYGANLARAGEQVVLIDVWEEHVRRIRADGLRMDGLHGTFTVPVEAVTDPAAAPKADVALICVNAYATREAAQAASVVLKDSGYALTLQNGLGNVESL